MSSDTSRPFWADGKVYSLYCPILLINGNPDDGSEILVNVPLVSDKGLIGNRTDAIGIDQVDVEGSYSSCAHVGSQRLVFLVVSAHKKSMPIEIAELVGADDQAGGEIAVIFFIEWAVAERDRFFVLDIIQDLDKRFVCPKGDFVRGLADRSGGGQPSVVRASAKKRVGVSGEDSSVKGLHPVQDGKNGIPFRFRQTIRQGLPGPKDGKPVFFIPDVALAFFSRNHSGLELDPEWEVRRGFLGAAHVYQVVFDRLPVKRRVDLAQTHHFPVAQFQQIFPGVIMIAVRKQPVQNEETEQLIVSSVRLLLRAFHHAVLCYLCKYNYCQ